MKWIENGHSEHEFMCDSEKKNIFLIGDSIRRGYCATTKEELLDKANVFYVNDNCRSTQYVIFSTKGWAGKFNDASLVDIVYFNCGHWDAAHWSGDIEPLTSLPEYEKNIKIKNVLMYDLKTSPNFIELRDTRKNEYLSLSDNMFLYENLADVLVNDTIIVSIGCQHLRSLAKELNGYNVEGKTFLLAMKGLEVPTAKIMHDIFKEEINQKSERNYE